MKLRIFKIISSGTALIAYLFSPCVASAQAVNQSKIKIMTYGIHYGNQIVYRYQIKNDSSSSINKVDLGLNSPGKELPGEPFSLDPKFSDVPAPVPPSICKPFAHMECNAAVFQFDYMNAPKTIIEMRGAELSLSPSPAVFSQSQFIRPGTLSSVAEVVVSKRSSGYLNASGTVWLFDNLKNPEGTFVTELAIPFTRIDTIPPSISGYVTSRSDKKMLAVNVTLKVTDNLDPNPEVSLVSVTANEAFRPKDVEAAIGTDTRSLKLKRKKGRIYYLNYRAMDGSDNASSVTISVPATNVEDERDADNEDRKKR